MPEGEWGGAPPEAQRAGGVEGRLGSLMGTKRTEKKAAPHSPSGTPRPPRNSRAAPGEGNSVGGRGGGAPPTRRDGGSMPPERRLRVLATLATGLMGKGNSQGGWFGLGWEESGLWEAGNEGTPQATSGRIWEGIDVVRISGRWAGFAVGLRTSSDAGRQELLEAGKDKGELGAALRGGKERLRTELPQRVGESSGTDDHASPPDTNQGRVCGPGSGGGGNTFSWTRKSCHPLPACPPGVWFARYRVHVNSPLARYEKLMNR